MITREHLEVVATAVGLLAVGGGLLAGTVAAATRLILLPWLREHLQAPLADVHHQVTVNGHTSSTPTVLDSVDATRADLGDLSRLVKTLAEDQHTMARVFDNHITWAERHKRPRTQSRYVFRRRDPDDY